MYNTGEPAASLSGQSTNHYTEDDDRSDSCTESKQRLQGEISWRCLTGKPGRTTMVWCRGTVYLITALGWQCYVDVCRFNY